jgi:hypothetical protein
MSNTAAVAEFHTRAARQNAIGRFCARRPAPSTASLTSLFERLKRALAAEGYKDG